MRKLLLAFEGGGTKTRILLADTEGTVLARETGGSASPLYIDQAHCARETRRLLKRIKRAADALPGRVTVAGLAAPMNLDVVQDSITGIFGKIPFVQCGEGDVAFALFGIEWGMSLVAGTGASCRARTRTGHSASCGGFGPQFGDEGSGYWIGRAAVSAAMRAIDGRGPQTVLCQSICEAFAIDNVFQVLRFVERSGHVPGPKIASLTPRVFDAARAGDVVARTICRQAGTALGRLVAAAAKLAAFEESPIPLVCTGGVFHGERLIVAPLDRVLRASGFEFHRYPPAAEPAEGIVRAILHAREGSI